MKRTTIMLPDDLAQLVDRERRRRDVSAAAVIREAVEAYFAPPAEPKRYSFIGIANSGGGGEFSAATIEEWLAREASSEEAYNRMKYGGPEPDWPSGNSDETVVDRSSDISHDVEDHSGDASASANG
jgi:hypothetical protein